MKKYILIVTLILINILFYINSVNMKRVEKVSLNLDRNELGVMFFNTDISNFILLNRNKKSIAFIIDCNNPLLLQEYMDNLKVNIDYLIMNEDYDITFANKKVIKDKITLNDIEFSYKKIKYNNKVICINNNKSCDYIYDTYNSKLIILEKDKIKDEYNILENSYEYIKIQ